VRTRHSTTKRKTERDKERESRVDADADADADAHAHAHAHTRAHAHAHTYAHAHAENDPVAAITLVATVSNCFVPAAGCACTPRKCKINVRLVWILTKTVFESASVDIIRVSAGVTVTVQGKQQTWTKQSLPQIYLCVGCQLNSDQALRSLYMKGHVRARGSTL